MLIPGAMIAGVALTTIASVASAVSAVASMGATALQKRAGAKGSVSQVMIGATMAVPYAMGRTYAGGMQVYDNSGGPAPNTRRWQINVVSAAGPIDSFESLLADYAPISFVGDAATGWFDNYLFKTQQLGARPEVAYTDEHVMPSWGISHKLSGYASYKLKMRFDKNGKRFASGIPQFGMVFKGVKVYDPRLDSTYPGGVGTQRWTDEATWAWSDNPALHALTYARGRFVGTVKIVGAGLPKDSIDIASFVELANLCDTNVWKVGGLIYEAPDLSKWDNLKRILQAGGSQPVWSGGMLRLRISAPRTSLFTITGDDLSDGSVEVNAMKGFRDRRNSIVPKYRSEASKWEYIQGNAVTASTYLTEDGELKTEEVQFDLVQTQNHAAQLAAYEMVNAREFGPITLTVKPRLLAYRLGEAGTINIPEAGLTNQLAIITARSVNPANGTVTLTLESETASKHAYALGLTGTAPPTPAIRGTQELDEAAAQNLGATFGIDLLESAGGAIATVPAYRTADGTAAAIAGQGALATANDVDFEGVRVINKGRVSRLSAASGNALGTFSAIDGRTFSKIAESRASRDGDAITFASTLPAVPKINFLPGGNAASAGQNIQIVAVGLTVSGFTMKAKSQAVTAGATITDITAVVPAAGEPTKIVDRSNSGAPFDGKFRFTADVTVGNIAPGEPGSIVLTIFVKQAAAWVAVGTGSRTSTGKVVVDVTPGAVDFGAGGEFGVSVSTAEGAGTALNALDSVVYTLGTVTETSLTPAGASDIPWLGLLQ